MMFILRIAGLAITLPLTSALAVVDHVGERLDKNCRTATSDNDIAAGQELPQHAMASVLVSGCTGTVISKGPQNACIITAAHCFRGVIGGKATVQFIDGSSTEATLLAVDRTRDFARFAIPSKGVLGVAPVQIGVPDRARYEAVGWPSHAGEARKPYYFLISPAPDALQQLDGEQFKNSFYTNTGAKPFSKSYDINAPFDPAPYRWKFNVDGGGALPGVSGAGIFSNGQLIGVLSNNNGHKVATACFASTPDQLVSFLEESDNHGCDKWQMGTWGAKAVNFSDAPPAIARADKSNQPLFDCANGKCWLRQAPSVMPRGTTVQGPVPPPPDAGHDNGPQPQAKQGGQSNSEIYSGHGKKPEDLNSIKKRTHQIDQDRHDIAELKRQAAESQAKLEEALRRAEQNRAQDEGPKLNPGPPEPPKKSGHPLAALACLFGIPVLAFAGDAIRRSKPAA